MSDFFNALLFLALVMAGAALIWAILVAPHAMRLRAAGNRRSYRDAAEAHRLIGQAESKMLVGEADAAEPLYLRALDLAQGVAPLLVSEANFGLARICERRGDLKQAAQFLSAALSAAPGWRDEKPAFEQFLDREHKRLLAELGKDSRN